MPTGERIHGPYPHRKGWRVVVIGHGRRVTKQCSTRAEAERLILQLRAQAQTRTVTQALGEYMQHLAAKGNRPRSIDTTSQRLFGLLEPVLDAPITRLTPGQAAALYRAYAAGRAADTHRNALGQARTWGKWLRKQGWLRDNPWDDVEPVGRRAAGKPQLRVDEARALRAWALARVEDDRACATLVALLLGLRASEIVSLTNRDVDAGGALLWVPGTKTRAARRELEIPPDLQQPLTARKMRPILFPYRREWVRDAAHWACEGAGVPRVCAHALRGLHATLRIELANLARDMGHGGPAVTQRHYIQPGTVERVTARRVAEVLGSSPRVPQACAAVDDDA